MYKDIDALDVYLLLKHAQEKYMRAYVPAVISSFGRRSILLVTFAFIFILAKAAFRLDLFLVTICLNFPPHFKPRPKRHSYTKTNAKLYFNWIKW